MMKIQKDNLSKPSDVGVIYKKKKQTRWGKGFKITKMCKNGLRWKVDHPKYGWKHTKGEQFFAKKVVCNDYFNTK